MTDPALPLPVQVRDLPAMRAAYMNYSGPPAGVGAPFELLQRFVTAEGIGPAGPLMASYPHLKDAAQAGKARADIEAMLLVPITRLAEPEIEGILTRRFASLRAACLVFSGPMDAAFRQYHLDLFAWMDARGLPRAGTQHQHAYLSKQDTSAHWTVEIRVPILAQGSGVSAL